MARKYNIHWALFNNNNNYQRQKFEIILKWMTKFGQTNEQFSSIIGKNLMKIRENGSLLHSFVITEQELLLPLSQSVNLLLGLCNDFDFKVAFGREIVDNYYYGITQIITGNGIKENIFGNFIQEYSSPRVIFKLYEERNILNDMYHIYEVYIFICYIIYLCIYRIIYV